LKIISPPFASISFAEISSFIILHEDCIAGAIISIPSSES